MSKSSLIKAHTNRSYPAGNPAQVAEAESLREASGQAHPDHSVVTSDATIAAALISASADVFLRIDKVTSIVGISVPTVYRLIAKGDFPKAVKLTRAARAWKLSEVVAWMESRVRNS